MRLLKQFLYGTFYLLIFAGVGWAVYSFALKPAPSCFDNKQNGQETGVDCGGSCISCAQKNLRPLALGSTVLFSADRVFSASAELRNPNAEYGAKAFDYEVNFYDGVGNILRNIKRNGVEAGFIYPGESKSIIEAGARITNGIPARAEIKLDEKSVVWEKKSEFFQPPFKLGDDILAILEEGQVAVSGNVTNLTNYNFSRATVNAFLIDKNGVRIGASKTELQNVGQFRVESFKIFLPVPNNAAPTLVNGEVGVPTAERVGIDLEATARSVFVEVLK